MKKIPTIILLFSAASMATLVMACGKRTETVEKTTVIERTAPVEQAPEATGEVGHMERAGEKIDGKVNRKIDRAIDSMLK